MDEDSDGSLVRRCCNGDRRAFEALVVRYERPVYNAALRMLHDREEARDVAQTVFLKVYEQITKPYRRQLQTGAKLPKKLNDQLNRELYARSVVKEMSGFEERDGTPIPTESVEDIMAFFERLPNLFADVMEQASTMSLFRDEVREGDAGN